jgi:REP element-mobilizing transposase RayT
MRRRTRRLRRPVQPPLHFPAGWGGRREGAGRPKSKTAGVSHARRAALASRYPVHVSLKVRPDVGRLRSKPGFRAVRAAFEAGCVAEGFRACHFSVQDNHIHIVAEAKDRTSLSRGLQGLCVRIARRLNRAFGRKGKVFADRYFSRILRTPREVRNALNYVLNNRLRHAPIQEGDWLMVWEDWASSAQWFDGWHKRARGRHTTRGEPPVAPAQTWLLTTGWRRHGLLVPVYNQKGTRQRPRTDR